MISGHIAESKSDITLINITKEKRSNAKEGLFTGSGNSLILLLRTFRYRSNVHSENRAGNEDILL